MEPNIRDVKFDPTDFKAMLAIMDKYGSSTFPFSGMNPNSEEIEVSISSNSITVKTFQENGRVRLNTFWRDGTCEETFDGRWKSLSRDIDGPFKVVLRRPYFRMKN